MAQSRKTRTELSDAKSLSKPNPNSNTTPNSAAISRNTPRGYSWSLYILASYLMCLTALGAVHK